MWPDRARLLTCALAALCLSAAYAQSKPEADKTSNTDSVSALERDFFSALRTGDSKKILSYIPERGLSVGANAHPTRDEIEEQFLGHRGLYCKLFDSSCIGAAINLDNSRRPCSYRELLTHSETVHTAASRMTRSGVQQAVLVARIQNSQCPNDKLIDFIFNLQAEGWKLFSMP